MSVINAAGSPRLSTLELLRECERRKDLLVAPCYSGFRVGCVVQFSSHHGLEAAETPQFRQMFGANIETGNLCNCTCAERVALGALRLLDEDAKLTEIVIVTDADNHIAPGAMCREFLSEHFNIRSDNVPIILGVPCAEASTSRLEKKQKTDTGSTLIMPAGESQSVFDTKTVYIKDLWRYPSIYRSKKRDSQVCLGKSFSETMESVTSHVQPGGGSIAEFRVLYEKTANYLKQKLLGQQDTFGLICQPITYAAGCECEVVSVGAAADGASSESDVNQEIVYLFAKQSQSMEYPCSVDAVSKLTSLIEKENDRVSSAANASAVKAARPCLKVLRILQVDQFGICHAPFSPARAYFFEDFVFGGMLKNVEVLIHDESKKLVVEKMKDLYNDLEGCDIRW